MQLFKTEGMLLYYCFFIVADFQVIWSIRENGSASETTTTSILLNAFVGITDCSGDSLDGKMTSPGHLQLAEAFIFATDKINKNNSLIPNVFLKLELHDTCDSFAKSLGVAYIFEYFKTATYGNIVGLQGDAAIGLSNILSLRATPQISFVPISDYQADRFKLFSVVASQETEIKVIVEFISSQNWTLFSLVYAGTMFGEKDTYKKFKKIIEEMDLCIVESLQLYAVMEDYHYNEVINKLLKIDLTKVVVCISGPQEMRGLFKAVHDLGVDGQLIWIGSSSWAGRTTSLSPKYRNAITGSFIVSPHVLPVKEFEQHLRALNPKTPSSRWLNETWELVFNCSLSAETCDENLSLTDSPEFPILSQAVYAIDAVYVLAHALHSLIASCCTNVTNTSDFLRNQKTTLFRYIERVSFKGFTGNIRFNDRRRMTDYVIKQVRPFKSTQFTATQFIVEKVVKMVRMGDLHSVQDVFPITWSFWRKQWGRSDEAGGNSVQNHKIQDSRCVKLCGSREVRIEKSSCCWDCFRCEDHEIFTSNLTECKKCAQNQWPDMSTNYTTCVFIDPVYPMIHDPGRVIIMIVLGLLGIAATNSVLAFYITNRKGRVIKASSRELSFLQLGAIFVGYVTVIFLMIRPSNIVCISIFFMLCLSFNALYTSLLIKTIRIYRIFTSITSKRHSLKGLLPRTQVMIFMALLFVQFVIFVLVTMSHTQYTQLIQPSYTEKKVFLICKIPSAGIICFACINLLLLLLCSILACKTRKLPDNFNESRYIAICIFTTLVIWIVTIAFYTFAAMMKYLLVGVALLLNHTVALVLLFCTRVYAVIRTEYMQTDSPRDETNVRGQTSTLATFN